MTNSIPASAIVQVTPNVLSAGGSALDLNAMVLTTSSRVPIGTVAEFSTADAVADYFGASAQEVTIAETYFLGFDGSSVKPGSILFTQYNTAEASAFLRGGDISSMALSALQALSGNLTITFDGNARTGAAIDLSGAASFSAAAGLIESGLNGSLPTIVSFTGVIAATVLTASALTGSLAPGQLVVGAGVTANTQIVNQLTGVEGAAGTYTVSISQTVGSEAMTTTAVPVDVTYDSVSGAFVITSGVPGAPSTASFATGTLAAPLLLTSATGAVLSQGAAVAVPATFMTALKGISQNWATFMTAFNPDSSGNTVKLAFAAWTNTQNNRFAYVCWDTDASPLSSNPATGSLGYLIQQADYSGTFLIYEPSDLNLAAFACGIAASINFDQTNGRTTFAFRRQSGLTASVTNETDALNLIANGYNFYGSYATANDNFIFLYPGSVSGPFEWMDSYIDQIWLNNAFQLALIELLVNVGSIPYNSSGYALIEAALADPINQGANFGAFRPGVTLSNSQIANVNNAAGKNISSTLQTRGWFLQVKDASPQVRAARGSPPSTFWYVDGQSVQKIDLASIELQ